MVVLRVLGWLLLAGAAVALGADVVASVQAGAVVTNPAGAIWYKCAPDSLNLVQAVVQRYIHPALWDKAIFPLLTLPAWVGLGLLGVLLVLLGQIGRGRR